MIRLLAGDLTLWVNEPNPCGRTYPRLPQGIFGRIDDMFTIRGENIYPSEIDAALNQLARYGGEHRIVITRDAAMDELLLRVHVDLVLAGHFRISDVEGEELKRNSERQEELFPLIRPVFEKMASIVKRHLALQSAETLFLVGGTSAFPGIETVMAKETGLPVLKPRIPLLVTPLGIALNCLQVGSKPTTKSTESDVG